MSFSDMFINQKGQLCILMDDLFLPVVNTYNIIGLGGPDGEGECSCYLLKFVK